ncbi:MAG: hypothetical protein KGR18_10280 [Acidobacteria bacterium]|nr:hypothetical protein [Acidobacteriota bacterium]
MSEAARVSITPEPTVEEAAAIAAAIEITRPQVVLADHRPTTPRWRFSGRWWSTPLPQRRPRP